MPEHLECEAYCLLDIHEAAHLLGLRKGRDVFNLHIFIDKVLQHFRHGREFPCLVKDSVHPFNDWGQKLVLELLDYGADDLQPLLLPYRDFTGRQSTCFDVVEHQEQIRIKMPLDAVFRLLNLFRKVLKIPKLRIEQGPTPPCPFVGVIPPGIS